MNIQDAVRTGKPVRRKSWMRKDFWDQKNEYFTLDTESLAADDWEILEEPIFITRADFYDAYKLAVKGRLSPGTWLADLIWKDLSDGKES